LLRSSVIVIGICAANSGVGSDYGTTGLIDIPTARMASDGYLTVGASFDGLHQSYSVTYQALPWLEGTFRYTGFEDFFFWDRNYGFKARLLEESEYLPQVAAGVRDAVGTGIFGSEYIVGSKRVGNLDLTAGLGWGRLAGKGQFGNPLSILDGRFDIRPDSRGLEDTGNIRAVFFRGEDVSLFGGVSYEFSQQPLKVVAEYNPDQYDFNNRGNRPEYRPSSGISYGIEWNPLAGIYVSLTHQHQDHVGFSIRSVLDTKALPSKPEQPDFISSLYLPQSQLPPQINKKKWYDRLLYDVERSGLLLVEGSISSDEKSAELVVGNTSYSLWSDAIGRHIALADLHLPASVETLYFVVEDGGHRSASIIVPRPSHQAADDLILPRSRVVNGRTLIQPTNRTGFATGKVINTVGVNTRFQLFDPDDPARYQIYLGVGSEYTINNHWSVKSAISVNLDTNFDESNRVESDSVLPNVRTGVVKYLTEGKTGLDVLLLEGRDTLGHSLHYRAFGGILEEMYSGLGGEVLWWPSRSRFAVGASLAYVKQRDFDKSLKHLDYEVVTGFLSAYWATPWHNYDAALHVGQYLAKDIGATLDIRRTFRNGWQVGLFATLTDIPFEQFGEGSFDKGFYFQVPIDGLFGNRTRSNISTRIRPVLRDGGQRLESHSGNIFWDLRQARYDALIIDKRLID
jgi:hypothetical protein